jgi:hypothetical protein
MNTQILKQKDLVLILIAVLMAAFGTQSISYAQEANPTITASVEAPLTEATLSGRIVTLTLSKGQFAREFYVSRALTISGIDGVTFDSWDVDRINDTKVTVELTTFSGNIDADTPLVFTVGASGIADYDGDALTTQLLVTAVEESLSATTETPLTETTLSGSVVTLTLNGRRFAHRSDIRDALTFSGFEGVTVSNPFRDVARVSDTEVTIRLTFSGNIDTDTPLTIEVGAEAIIGYDQTLTVQLPVTAVEESLTATTETPLAEATLDGSVVTLTLTGRRFTRDIRDALTFSGIEGVYVAGGFWDGGVQYLSDTEATVELAFFGNIDTDGTLTLTVGAAAIGYDKDFTFNFPVTAVEESLTASTETPLTEANLQGGIITLILNGRQFTDREWDIEDALTLSGIEGVTVSEYFGVDRVSDTEATVELAFFGNIDTDATLTLTVGAAAIGYTKDFTFNLPVTAVEESLTTTTEAPLTEADLQGGVITLTLSGRQFANSRDIEEALTVSGIEGVTVSEYPGVERISDTEATVVLDFFGNIDTDATLTLTVGAAAIGYTKDFTFNFPVTAVEESLTASPEAPLTEANLDVNSITLTLSGRRFAYSRDIEEALTLSGIGGVYVSHVRRVSDTETKVNLTFAGDFDTDATLTLTVGAEAIGYTKDFIFNFPVTAVKQSDATVSISPSPIALPGIGENLTLNLDIVDGKNVVGYQATVSFDPSVLDYVESANGNYLPADTFFFVDPIDRYRRLVITGNTLAGTRNGDGTLATLTFKVVDYKPSMVTLSDVYLVDADGKRWEVTIENGEILEPPQEIFGDINLDGNVNIQDLVIVSDRFGLRGRSGADVNGDGLVDIVDLVLVANAFGANAAAPPLNPQEFQMLTTTDVKGWLTQAKQLTRSDPAYLRGITVLEQLYKALTPKATILLPNFPNPFNPETWIPFHLSKDADVTLHIYAMNGTLVRTLALGHQPAGMYQNRSRAAYWDGKNALGEKVASGVYFYTFTAGDFTATRKMLIRK